MPCAGTRAVDCSAALARAVERPDALTRDEVLAFLCADDPAQIAELFAAARLVRRRVGRDTVLPRGLIECSNVCAKNCLYCGIRRANAAVHRYRLSEEVVGACIDDARQRGYPAVAFQAGEIESEANTAYYERLLAQCRGLEVTLSLGEQTEEVYRRWKDAGALRYLLRIETSNPRLYAQIHPADCSFARRVECLRALKRLGYVTGSGVMIGLPGQTLEDLADDLAFFRDMRLDMVGMGPFVPHPDTPLGKQAVQPAAQRLDLALKMIALARLTRHAVNIVAATALEALGGAAGWQRGLEAGANVVMPDLTPSAACADYSLYPGKPGTHVPQEGSQ